MTAKPLPSPTGISKPFWEALKAHRVDIQQCRKCSHWIFFPRQHCPSCFSQDLAWKTIPGTGTLVTYTVARIPTLPEFSDESPQKLAVVAFDEGPHINTTLVGLEESEIQVGMRLKPVFDDVAPGRTTLLRFTGVDKTVQPGTRPPKEASAAAAGASQGAAAALLARQKAAFIAEGPVSRETRVARIQRVIDLLVKHNRALTDAMDADFGGRSRTFSLMNDVLGSLNSLKHAREKLGEWMQPEKRQPFPPYDQLGAEAWVQYQPKGSVGILGTWNAPLFTLFAPLAYVLAAGNRAILKPSEVTPGTADVVSRIVAEAFDPLEVAVVTGGPEVAQAFTAQPFDHIVFTGSTPVARSVMRNAAENLVPLTLELGGKSPTIIGRSADLKLAAWRIALAKATNAGQLCVNPDVTYVPADKLGEFMAALRASYEEFFPAIRENRDVTAVVNAKHLARVEGYLADAAAKGVRIETLSETVRSDDTANRRRGLRVAVNPAADTEIMKHEIFGPAMVVETYERLEEAVADVNSRPRPLALYYFGEDAKEQDYVLGHTLSGGVTLNDTMMHPGMLDAPFGGIGDSGMGHYHGREGFIEFSHVRTVFKAPAAEPRKEWGTVPPYPQWLEAFIESNVTP